MKTKALYILFGFLLLSGMGASIYFGLAPKPIPKIKFSLFEEPIKLAQAIELRLQEEIKKSPVLAFGYQPEKPAQLEILRQFLKINSESGLKYDVIVTDAGLGDLGAGFEGAEKIPMKEQLDDLSRGIQTALQSNHRVMMIMPSSFSSQLIPQNVVGLLKHKLQIPITSFSIVELLRTRESEKSVSIPCFVSDTGQDVLGAGPLGCAILQQSRLTYRKKGEVGKKAGLMDQRGLTDYLIFFE